jgi:guanylate kinase
MTNNGMSPAVTRRGILMVLVAPSGAGKTTIMDALLAGNPDLKRVITVTTRAPRDGEVQDVSYYFKTDAEFQDMVSSGGMLEHATVFKRSYGIPRGTVVEALEAGVDQVIITDWQGHRTLREQLPDDVIGVYIAPPSLNELERRLEARGDKPEVIRQRMSEAEAELSHQDEFEHVVLNEVLAHAVADIQGILEMTKSPSPTWQMT